MRKAGEQQTERSEPGPPARSSEFWEAQYAAASQAEALVRGLLPRLPVNSRGEQAARQALRAIADVCEFLLQQSATAESLQTPGRSDDEQWLLKRSEVAAKLGIGESMLDKLVKAGVIP